MEIYWSDSKNIDFDSSHSHDYALLLYFKKMTSFNTILRQIEGKKYLIDYKLCRFNTSRKIPIGVLYSLNFSTVLTTLLVKLRLRHIAWIKITKNYKRRFMINANEKFLFYWIWKKKWRLSFEPGEYFWLSLNQLCVRKNTYIELEVECWKLV